MFGPNSRFSQTVFIEDGASGKQGDKRKKDANQYANAANSLSTITTAGGLAQNRYSTPTDLTRLDAAGNTDTPTVTTPSQGAQSGSPAQGTPTEGSGDVSNDFATQFGNFNTTYSSLEANGTINDYQKLLSEIQAYKATLTGAGNEELLKQLAELETQITGKIKGKEITQRISAFGTDIANLGDAATANDYNALLAKIQEYKGTLTGEGNEAFLQQLADLEAQLTGKINTANTNEKISAFGTSIANLENNGTINDYQKLLSEIQLFKNTLTGEGNEEFLKQLATLEAQAKAKIEKLSQGSPMSYEDYLKNYGEDTRKNYLASVKAANDDYYRALMTYGMNAETLAGGGLTGAGVSSYGNDAAWAARQGAVSYAGAVKQAADTENAKTYFDYVQKFNASQKAETEAKTTKRYGIIDELLKSGETNAETIKMRLGMSGLFTSEEIESLGNQIASGATRVATEADVTAASEFFASCIEGGLGIEAAKLAVSQKYGDNVANKVAKNHTDVIKTEIKDLVGQYDPAKTDQDAIAELTAYQKQGYLTPEEAEGHISTIQGKNAEYYGTLFEQARDQYDADKVLAALGIEVAEGADEATIMAEATKAAREALMQAHDNGAITTEKAVDIMTGDFANEIETVTSSEDSELWLQHACDKLLVWENYSGELGTDMLYKNVLALIREEITIKETDFPNKLGYPKLEFIFGGKSFYNIEKDALLNLSDGDKITYYHTASSATTFHTMEPNQSQMLRTIYNVWTAKNNAADAYVGAASGI